LAIGVYLEFEAVLVLPEITQNYGNYRYGNNVGNVPRRYGNFPKDIKTENALLAALLIYLKILKMRLCASSSPDSQ